MDWWYNYESIGSYYNVMKREILASLTDSELRSMIADKRMNIEFNEKLKHYKTTVKDDTVHYHMVAWLNEVYIDMLNAPLIKCIEVFDREIRNRSSEKKKNQVDLGELKAKIDIVEVVQSYVSLGRYKPGQLIKCPLPMHKDKTASCMLYQKNNTWHCHGCHQGWSQLDFIMLMTGCSLPDAIKKLSNF